MDPNLRKGWTEIITPDDIDRHLKDIGQASANASLVSEMLNASPPKPHSKFLVAGAGTGQMFDFIAPTIFVEHDVTFTDINPAHLERLKKRLGDSPKAFRYQAVVDDLEQSKLVGPFDAALIVLVLEHIDWRRGVETLVRLQPKYLYFVIQRNEPGAETVNTKRDLAPSIKEFIKIAAPRLVQQNSLLESLKGCGYKLAKSLERSVPDQKTMVGLVVEK